MAGTGSRASGGRWAWLVLAMLALACFDVDAARKIKPGQERALKPDEGLLLVAVDSNASIQRLRFRREDAMLGGGSLASIEEGRTFQLYAVEAGRYRWSHLTVFSSWAWSGGFDLSEDDEFRFEVVAGKVNYPGDIVYRSTGYFQAHARMVNRALPALDWLEAEHPALASLPFDYNGHYPDPFPAFYREAVSTHGTTAGGAAPELPAAAALPLDPALLWQPDAIDGVSLSPDGRLLAQSLRKDADDDRRNLLLFDVETGQTELLLASEVRFSYLRWESDRILLAGNALPFGPRLFAFHVGEPGPDGRRGMRRVDGPDAGRIVDLLPSEPGVVLWEKLDSRGGLVVHPLSLQDEQSVRQFARIRVSERLNSSVKQDISWFADGYGRLRAAYARDTDDNVVLVHGSEGTYRSVLQYQPDAGFELDQLSFDGDLLYGFTEEGRAQREFVEFDPALPGVTRTIHRKPGIDLVGAVYGEDRTPIGATYYEGGRLVTDYFDDADRVVATTVRNTFPDRNVATVARSQDAQRRVLMVDGSDQPAGLYLLDSANNTAEPVGEMAPQLSGHDFAPSRVLQVRTDDGMEIEAFLTMPRGFERPPLVVMPHGGPVGIRDVLHFNPEVQFVAALGYAVLQVNFRGSEGYGTAFREAAHGNYGARIEDDIEAAIESALAAEDLDGSRMCAVGSSYGGYSGMVLALRRPDRFRCVVSISGVSDLALFFTASDSGRIPEVRERLEKLIGNPAVPAELAGMQARSPLYAYRDLHTPLMLVHGDEDARVDYEHTRRLSRLLGLDGRPPVVLSLEDVGHNLGEIEDTVRVWTSVAGFLARHLPPTPGTAGAPAR